MRTFERALPIALEVTGRVIEGTALTFDRPYRVSDDKGRTFYHEGWRPGAFTDGIAEVGNVNELRLGHDDVRAGRVSYAQSARALAFVATADSTPLGDAVLEHVDAGTLAGVSLRFESDRQVQRDGVVWRLRGRPRELSIVLEGQHAQYDDALITARRALEVDDEAIAALRARALRASALAERSARNLAAAARLL